MAARAELQFPNSGRFVADCARMELAPLCTAGADGTGTRPLFPMNSCFPWNVISTGELWTLTAVIKALLTTKTERFRTMRKMLVATTAAAALILFAAPASAATLVATTGTPLSEVLKTNSGIDGTSITYFSDPSNYAVQYSSTDLLHPSSSGGFAFVEGASSSGFSDLTITPETVTFSAFKFNLQLPAATGPSIPNGYHTAYTFDAQLFFAGGGSQTFDNIDLGNGAGTNRFLITAGSGQQIDKILLSDLVGISTRNNDPTLTNDFNFDSVRQVSFNTVSGVPEPSTWAMFILGFGFIGGMLRMRSRRPLIA